ncbi:hypothetical protein T484DRAFT_1756751 [Baffinella frigidus]|nr:hypothetical protein T484DRAFT_1756751 [Cryptophyta sp. CCMP2293]
MPLSWDLETLGLDPKKEKVTVCSLYDPVAKISRVLRFVDLSYECEVVYVDNVKEIIDELVQYLDAADYLISFNGVNFDSKFLQVQFKIPPETVQRWILKTFDILEICRRAFSRTFNLNSCLALNGVGDGKTGSGMEAVHQARRGDWIGLERYCLDDSRLTYELSMKPVIFCCENYQWRKAHNDRTHDPARVLMIHTSEFPKLSFSYGPLPGYNADEADGSAVLGKRALSPR